MKISIIMNPKARFCHVLLVGNTLYDIQADSYIAIAGSAKPNVIVRTDEQVMLGRKLRKYNQGIKNLTRYQLNIGKVAS